MNSKLNPAEVASLLFEYISRSKNEWWKITERHHLTPLQFYILEVLHIESIPMNGLGSRLACDASNVTGLVDRLSAQGLIERHEHPNDRRIKIVSITKKGEEKRQLVLKSLASETSFSLARLSFEELGQLEAILHKLISPAK